MKASSFGNNVTFRFREHKGLAGKEPGTASQQPMGTLKLNIRQWAIDSGGYSGSYKVGFSTHATFFLKLLQNQAQTTAF